MRRSAAGVKAMAILITGGYGQLGSWLAREFAESGEDVLLFDIFERRLDYLAGFEDKITFVRGSVLDFPRIVEVFKGGGPGMKGGSPGIPGARIDGIVHTVAVMATPEFWQNPHSSVSMNVMGTLNLLEAARIFGVKKFLYASSGAVYGEVEERANELKHPMNPSDLYGASKAAAEHIGRQYANHYGIDWRCARPFFFFGPGKLPSEQPFLFRNLLGPLEGLEGLHLEKGADQRLGFTYVKDTARGVALLYRAGSLRHTTMNFSSEVPVSFPDMVRLAQKYSAKPTEVKMGPGKLFRRGETLDISLAKEELGFKPRYGVEDGMREYAEWIGRNR
jgi:nucleoside-diphosphate-sugar epimerase